MINLRFEIGTRSNRRGSAGTSRLPVRVGGSGRPLSNCGRNLRDLARELVEDLVDTASSLMAVEG